MKINETNLISELESLTVSPEGEAYIRCLCHNIINSYYGDSDTERYALRLCQKKINELELLKISDESSSSHYPTEIFDIQIILTNLITAFRNSKYSVNADVFYKPAPPVYAVCSEKMIIRSVCEIITSLSSEHLTEVSFSAKTINYQTILSAEISENKHYKTNNNEHFRSEIIRNLSFLHTGKVFLKLSPYKTEIKLILKSANNKKTRISTPASAEELISDKFNAFNLVFGSTML